MSKTEKVSDKISGKVSNKVSDDKISSDKSAKVSVGGQVKPGRKTNSMEAFIEAHETSSSYDELATKLGITRASAYQRALQYRKRGVDLKQFSRKNRATNLTDNANAYLIKIRQTKQSENETVSQ